MGCAGTPCSRSDHKEMRVGSDSRDTPGLTSPPGLNSSRTARSQEDRGGTRQGSARGRGPPVTLLAPVGAGSATGAMMDNALGRRLARVQPGTLRGAISTDRVVVRAVTLFMVQLSQDQSRSEEVAPRRGTAQEHDLASGRPGRDRRCDGAADLGPDTRFLLLARAGSGWDSWSPLRW